MRCRTFFTRNLSLGGYLLLFLNPLQAEVNLASALVAAKKRQDWSTTAETAIRWLEKDPSQAALLEDIAHARLQQNEVDDCAKWLARWEASVDQPTAAMLALRGDLARLQDNRAEAREHWVASFELAPSQEVARSLSDSDLWNDVDRTDYESTMARVAKNYHFVQALKVTTEAAVRERDWTRCLQRIETLNNLGTQSGMSTAAIFEAVVGQREVLAQHDARVKNEHSCLNYARRADFFRAQQLLQLAIEDARKARSLAPRMVLPRITLALCLAAQKHEEELTNLRVVVRKNQALLDEKTRLALDKLDHAASESLVKPMIFLDRALVLASTSQPYLALDDLELAGPALKASAKGWTCLGKCRAIAEDTTGAQQAFEEALKQDATHADAWEALANLAMDRADYPEAIRRLTWLVKHAPDPSPFSKQRATAEARLR